VDERDQRAGPAGLGQGGAGTDQDVDAPLTDAGHDLARMLAALVPLDGMLPRAAAVLRTRAAAHRPHGFAEAAAQDLLRVQPGDAFRFPVEGANAAIFVDGDDRGPRVVQAEGRVTVVEGCLA